MANGEILGGLAVHLALTGLPGVAIGMVAISRGVRNVPLLLCIGLAGSGLVALLAFWAYYASPTVGQAWDYVVLFGSIELALWSWLRGGLDRGLLRELRTPLLLWILGCTFVTFLGFLHGGDSEAIGMSALRFSSQLPSDNDIPRFYAEWFAAQGHEGTPPMYPGEWLMSDRPPLQVGYVLSQRAFVDDVANLNYQLVGVVIQHLWIVAMWAVLTAARVRPSTRSLAMFAALVSDIAIVHGFFVWPKLLAATFLLAALALVIGPQWTEQRRDWRLAALFGCLCGLAMLAHGASIFGLIPLLAVAALRGLPSWRWLVAAAIAGLVLLVPWTAYQSYADPPGNRLLKWQLGGETRVTDEGTLEAIGAGYRDAGVGGTIANKVDNFAEMAGWPGAKDELINAVDRVGDGEIEEAVAAVRRARFFCLAPLLGIFLIAPVAMLLARRRGDAESPEWRFALISLLFAALGCLAWGLLLFGPPEAGTYLHVGTLALPLLALVGCVVGLCATWPRLAAAVVGVNSAAVLAIYVPSLQPPPGTDYSPIAAVLAAASLAGFGAIAFGLRGRSGL